MSKATTRIESLVREKDDIVKEVREIEGWLTHMRVTPEPLEDREPMPQRRILWWRDSHWSGPSRVPHAVTDAFYFYLHKRSGKLRDRLAAIELVLEGATAHTDGSRDA